MEAREPEHELVQERVVDLPPLEHSRQHAVLGEAHHLDRPLDRLSPAADAQVPVPSP
jgi:hypothetical protein